jgi:hypothetical protein
LIAVYFRVKVPFIPSLASTSLFITPSIVLLVMLFTYRRSTRTRRESPFQWWISALAENILLRLRIKLGHKKFGIRTWTEQRLDQRAGSRQWKTLRTYLTSSILPDLSKITKPRFPIRTINCLSRAVEWLERRTPYFALSYTWGRTTTCTV